MAPDSTNNSYTVEIDGTTCGVVVGDNAAATANTWKWVDYQNGTTSSKITVSLTAGTHTITMIGREDNVKVDRVLLVGNQACVPIGVGDNCAAAQDATAPAVAITTPVANANIANSGTLTVTATATDAGGISSVSLKYDGTVLGPMTSGGNGIYSYTLNLSGLVTGAHSLVATATDTNQNVGSGASISIFITAPVPVDTTPPVMSLTSPSTGSTVSGTVAVSATATDAVGVSRVEFWVDGALTLTDQTAPYSYSWDTTTLADGNHTLAAKAYDAANNMSSATATVTIKNTIVLKNGDVNGDTKVDIFDLSIMLNNYGTTGTRSKGDLNGDGKIDIFDLSVLLAAWGT